MATMAQHHHRSTTKASHKPFKSKHSTKSALKERSKGKVETEIKGQRRTPHQQVMSKLDRRNQAKQKRTSSNQDHVRSTTIFSGRDGAPRIVAVVPLCNDTSSAAAVRSLNASLGIEAELPSEGWTMTEVERFNQKISYIPVRKSLVAALDACRVADFVVFVLSAEQEVDDLGELMLRCIESQGVSNVMTVVQGLDAVEPQKRRPQVLASLKSFITHFFPTQEKLHSLDSRQDCANLIRSLCTITPKGVKWREDRSWMMVEDVRWPKSPDVSQDITNGGDGQGEVVLTGVIRGRSLKADRLVQIGDWGAFQVEKILAAPRAAPRSRPRLDEMVIEVQHEETILDRPTADQDALQDLAPEEAVMEDHADMPMSLAASDRKGVLLDDHHYFSDEEESVHELPKRLPRGTSKYQSAWYLDDVSDSGSDLEDVQDKMDTVSETPAAPADGIEGLDRDLRDPTEAGATDYPASEMFLDPSPEDESEQLAAYRSQRRSAAEEDLEFPDEIELQPNVLARERLARYRGLRSLKTSPWETEEDKPYQPEEWRRLLEIADYRGAKNRVTREALVGGVQPGSRVSVHIRNVPLSLQRNHDSSNPPCLFSLLRHEHKRTACNFSIVLSSDYPNPIKSKEEIIVQCGPRRLVINPLFSQAGNTSNNVHKFDRFLHPGRSAVASFTGPLTWGAVPALYFKRTNKDSSNLDTDLTLIGTGTCLAPSSNRVIAKRIILTGHPYKIHKRLVTVRYMFFNTEDVQWFKALQLWTKRGRSGFIKESLGTHGYFKATFDGKINPMDSVAMSLYKRVWPRPARLWNPAMEESGDGGAIRNGRETDDIEMR